MSCPQDPRYRNQTSNFPNWKGNIGFSPWLLKIVAWVDGGLL